MRIVLPVLATVLLFVCSCADTDPYKRLGAEPSKAIEVSAALKAYQNRWPERFKTVQTVTLDFQVQTRTLMGYLLVQRPGKFRLQGMSEQGLKLFDIAFDGQKTHVVFAAAEFEPSVLENVSRDIQRIFLNASFEGPERVVEFGNSVELIASAKNGDLRARLVDEPAKVDSYKLEASDRWLYRVDQYEWQDLGGHFGPSVIVLRERGVQSDGPPYKLTAKITEFETREEPWPDAVFDAPEDE